MSVCIKKGRKKAGGPAVSEVGGENAHWKYKSQTERGEEREAMFEGYIPELASDNLHTCERVNFTINKSFSFLFHFSLLRVDAKMSLHGRKGSGTRGMLHMLHIDTLIRAKLAQIS